MIPTLPITDADLANRSAREVVALLQAAVVPPEVAGTGSLVARFVANNAVDLVTVAAAVATAQAELHQHPIRLAAIEAACQLDLVVSIAQAGDGIPGDLCGRATRLLATLKVTPDWLRTPEAERDSYPWIEFDNTAMYLQPTFRGGLTGLHFVRRESEISGVRPTGRPSSTIAPCPHCGTAHAAWGWLAPRAPRGVSIAA
ncbi:hypothetical protein [Belnapia sp. F-4-1]|uniref:hypothetical protein n=1 Tax=Belnapia sp. F-4-1 TaxID=1545443 RepID=UPI0005B97A47|nr:hypothetical protein [Belnapia sp. F-4-1]